MPSHLAYLLVGATVPVAVLVGARVHRPARARGWYLVAIGAVGFWTSAVVRWSGPTSDAVIGGAVVLRASPRYAVTAALVVFARSRSSARRRTDLLDIAIISVSVAALTWATVVSPALSQTQGRVAAVAVLVAAVGNVAMIASMVLLALTLGRDHSSQVLFWLASLALLVFQMVQANLAADAWLDWDPHWFVASTPPLRPGQRAALMMLDLDRFTMVNDSLGHQAGDELLVQVSTRLADVLPAPATLVRLGGDEFAVVLPDGERRAAERVAGVLRHALGPPVLLESLPVHCSVSVGIALAPAHGTDLTTLMRRADVAMYAAKRTGRPEVYGGQGEDAAEQLVL